MTSKIQFKLLKCTKAETKYIQSKRMSRLEICNYHIPLVNELFF